MLLSVLCCPCPQSLPTTGQTSPSLPVRYPQRPLQFTVSSCILACWQVIFDDQPTRDPFSPQKKLKKFIIFATIRTFLFFPFFFLQSFIPRCRMSKSSTATAPKNPTPLLAKSAWAKGPPQSSSTAPSPRSQSPAPSTPVLQSHSRRPSALGQGIPIKDGVSIPRNNVGAVKQGLSLSSFF